MRGLFWIVGFLCTATVAHADGGRLLMREPAGPFVVSLFCAPETLAVGPVDLSAMAEEKSSGRVLLDATITVTLTPVDRKEAAPIVISLARAGSADRLLQDAIVQLPRAGSWRAMVNVKEGAREGSATAELSVADHSSRRGTIWFFALFPLAAVALFAWTQLERRPKLLRAT